MLNQIPLNCLFSISNTNCHCIYISSSNERKGCFSHSVFVLKCSAISPLHKRLQQPGQAEFFWLCQTYWCEVSFNRSRPLCLYDCTVQSCYDLTGSGSRAALCLYFLVLWATQWGTLTSLDSTDHSLSIAPNPEDRHININHFKKHKHLHTVHNVLQIFNKWHHL